MHMTLRNINILPRHYTLSQESRPRFDPFDIIQDICQFLLMLCNLYILHSFIRSGQSCRQCFSFIFERSRV